MAELAITEPYSFWALVTRAQESGPWRDWRAQRQTAVPQRFVFLPYPWSVVKQHLQHMVDAQARIAQKEAQMPEIFREYVLGVHPLVTTHGTSILFAQAFL